MTSPDSAPLHVKVIGPRAIPIQTLVERGEAAAERVSKEYPDYARTLIPKIVATGKALLKKQATVAEWNSLYTSFRDLRTSGESANQYGLVVICESLEIVFMRCDRNDARLPKVIDLHLDALTLAVAEAISQETLRSLHQELKSAANILTLGDGYVSP